MKSISPRDVVLSTLEKGLISRSMLTYRTRMPRQKLDLVLEELKREGLVRIERRRTGQRGLPTTWIELMR